MRRILLVAAIAALALPGAAVAKGPSAVTIAGPGLAEPIVLVGSPEENSATRFGRLVTQSGWFQLVFQQTPDQTLRVKPKGRLGPAYVAVYTVPADKTATATVRQVLYPYAAAGPLAYMRAAQPLFGIGTLGGWYRASPALRRTLIALGFPAKSPT